MSAQSELTATRLREVLDYDPATGHFTHKRRPANNAKDRTWNTRYAGERAGYLHKPSGYWIISIDDVKYKAHRLAHLYMKGTWPPATIDHRWGQRADNRWKSLRRASVAQNNLNHGVRRDNASGCPGVSFCKKTGNWRAYISRGGVWYWLGYHDTREDAVAARESAARTLFGKFAPNRPVARAARWSVCTPAEPPPLSLVPSRPVELGFYHFEIPDGVCCVISDQHYRPDEPPSTAQGVREASEPLR